METSRTPILDLLDPMPEPPPHATQVSQAVIGALCGGVGTVVVYRMLERAGYTLPVIERWVRATVGGLLPGWPLPARLAAVAIAAAAGLVITIVVHECGHVFAGLAAGFRFNQMRIGQLQIDRPFRVSRYRGKGTGSSGWASLFPVSADHLAARAAVLLLGGPLANLATAALVWVVPVRTGMLGACVAGWSILLGLINLVPFRNRAVLSDGKRLWTLLFSPAQGLRFIALIRLTAELRAGVPPESLSPDFLAHAIAVADHSPDTVVAHAIAYANAYWRRNDERAAEMLEAALAHADRAAPITRHGLMSDSGVFQARRRKRVDLAERWLAKVPARTEIPGLRERVEAAILESRGDPGGAIRKLDEVEALVSTVPNEAQRESMLRLHRRWKAEVLAHRLSTE
jgi:hypothetical protein